VHEVEVVGGVPEAVEVGAEAGAPLVGVLGAAARPDRGRIGALSKPTRNVDAGGSPGLRMSAS